jgi:hypothetical protein
MNDFSEVVLHRAAWRPISEKNGSMQSPTIASVATNGKKNREPVSANAGAVMATGGSSPAYLSTFDNLLDGNR